MTAPTDLEQLDLDSETALTRQADDYRAAAPAASEPALPRLRRTRRKGSIWLAINTGWLLFWVSQGLLFFNAVLALTATLTATSIAITLLATRKQQRIATIATWTLLVFALTATTQAAQWVFLYNPLHPGS